MNDNHDKQIGETLEKTSTESRRAFLKKAGAFAIYTPPAITMLMHPSHASIMKSPGGKQHKHHGFRRGNGHQ